MRTNTAVAERTRTAVALNPRLLSLREAIVLAGVPDKEKDVRNDINHGIFPAASIVRFENSRLCFHWPYVPTFAAVYGNALLEDANLRRVALTKVFIAASGHNACLNVMDAVTLGSLTHDHFVIACKHYSSNAAECGPSARVVDIDNYIGINLGKACEAVKPRLDVYARGLMRVEEKDSVLGGAAVFRDSRVSVTHIGLMAIRGETIDNILADYSHLTVGDVEFAKLYCLARPAMGRPRKSGGVADEAGHKR